MNKLISDILRVPDDKQMFDNSLAIVEFTVVYFNPGDFVSYNEMEGYILWEGEFQVGYHFVPSGREENRSGEDGLLLNQKTFAIVDIRIFGNSLYGWTALQNEYDTIGRDIIDGNEKELLDIAKSIRPAKSKFSTFVTLWNVVYDSYTSIEESMEYDVYVYLIGLIDLNELYASMINKEKMK